MSIRDAVPSDRDAVKRLINENVGHGPYLDSCLDKIGADGGFSLVCEADGEVIAFIIVLRGASISTDAFDGYERLLSLIEEGGVYTGYFLVVDGKRANRGVGHEMIAETFARIKKLGGTQFFCECIVPPSYDADYRAGKIHWVPRGFDIKSLFYEYYPAYFALTTPSDEDFCMNCGGKCHCGAAIFLGRL